MAMEYFPCYDSYLNKVRCLSDQELGRLFRALMVYHTSGGRQELAGREAVAFDFIADDIDRATRSYDKKCRTLKENGKANATRCYQMIPDDTRCEQMVADAPKAKANTKANTKAKANTTLDKTSDSEPAHYGEFGNVLLSDEELKKLQAAFPDWQKRIDQLDGYIEATGKKYKSHYAAILNWARRDEQKPAHTYQKQKPGDIHGCSELGSAELEAIQRVLREEITDEEI